MDFLLAGGFQAISIVSLGTVFQGKIMVAYKINVYTIIY